MKDAWKMRKGVKDPRKPPRVGKARGMETYEKYRLPGSIIRASLLASVWVGAWSTYTAQRRVCEDSIMRKKNYSTASNEHGCTKPYKFNVEVADGSTSSTSSLIVFQLLIRCVHPWAMRHPRTWSAVARSLTVISSSDWISACIIVSRVIIDGSQRHRWWSCWQAQRTSASKRWIHRVHDQLTRTGKRTYGLYFVHIHTNCHQLVV